MAINLTYASQETVLNQGMANLLNSSMLKDTVLACTDGQCLKAHRLILSTFSPYFKELLSVCKEPMPTILLPEVKISVMHIQLEFMYTGNVHIKKDLVAQLLEVNKCLLIKGLNNLLSKHDDLNQPTNKRQRTDSGSQAPKKSSSLFRPWDSPILSPRPEYHNSMPWIPTVYASSMLPFPMAPAMNLSKPTPFFNMSGIVSNMPSPLSWTMPFGYPLLPDSTSSEHIPTSFPHHFETPLSATASMFQNAVTNSTSHMEQPFTLHIPESSNKELKTKVTSKKSKTKSEGRYLAPGKERCDICKRGFRNLLGHKKSAHGLLKNPILCCGIEFTTRQTLREHKRSVCDFRNLW